MGYEEEEEKATHIYNNSLAEIVIVRYRLEMI
jgi:hypothetical protein